MSNQYGDMLSDDPRFNKMDMGTRHLVWVSVRIVRLGSAIDGRSCGCSGREYLQMPL